MAHCKAGLALGLLFVPSCGSHNWVHNPRSRSGNKASTLIPGPPKPTDRDPHVAVGANGQTFAIEWVTGHPNSIFYFVVLAGADEANIELHTEELLDSYIAQAPDSAYERYNSSSGYWAKSHLSCSYLYGQGDDCDSCKNCGQGDDDYNDLSDTSVYAGLLSPSHASYINRTAVFESDEDGDYGVTHMQYLDSVLADDTRVAYYNADYPWIEAVHRFTVEKKWAQEFDTARFDIPARQGSGEYLVHMVWRGYRDIIDVDVLPSDAVDVYGQEAEGTSWIKTDHCQYQKGTYESSGVKSWKGGTCFPLWDANGYNATSCLEACESLGQSKCTAANVVPLTNPPNVVDFLADTVNIPRSIIKGSGDEPNTDCTASYMIEKYPQATAKNDTLVCYGLLPNEDTSNEEVDDPWTIIDNDPQDPIFYSTCYRQGTAWEFVGNVACPKCEGANASVVPWRYGGSCISCDEVARVKQLTNVEVPWWDIRGECEVC